MNSSVDSEVTPGRRQHWQVSTKKRRRENFRRRKIGRPECTSTIIISRILLALIASSNVASTLSLSFVKSASSPPNRGSSNPLCSGLSRVTNSNSFFMGATLAPKSISALKDKGAGVDEKLQIEVTSGGIKSGENSRVEVWDGVFSPEVCQDLHDLAIDHSERTTGEDDDDDNDDSLDGSSIFFHRGRNRSEDDQLTPIEQALDSFLTAYYNRERTGDDDPNREIVVEYWCRQEHLNLEAHADVDEVSFERSCKKMNDPKFRYPSIGHVLYLTKPTLGLGPTCVFPPTTTTGRDYNADSSIKDEIASVLTIPAVPGRILRFPGNALHGVPKPADVWFSRGDGASASEYDDNVDAEWNDEDDDDDDEERSVILFNTWETSDDDTVTDISVGPIGVSFDPMFHANSDIGIVEMMMSSVDMDGVEVDEDFVKGMVAYAKQQKNDQLKDWYEKYSVHGTEQDPTKPKSENVEETVVYSKVNCQPSELWELSQIDKHHSRSEGNSNGDKGTITVPLMGDEIRRRYTKNVVCWPISTFFEKGVKESEKPCEFPLED